MRHKSACPWSVYFTKVFVRMSERTIGWTVFRWKFLFCKTVLPILLKVDSADCFCGRELVLRVGGRIGGRVRGVWGYGIMARLWDLPITITCSNTIHRNKLNTISIPQVIYENYWRFYILTGWWCSLGVPHEPPSKYVNVPPAQTTTGLKQALNTL